MFTTPCFIRKSTPELRRKLDELGYFPHPTANPLYNHRSGALYTGRFFYSNIPTGTQEENSKIIDCGTNEELFLAVAALRDNSDKYQYFVTEEEMHWPNQDTWMSVGSFIFSYVDNYTDTDGKIHKATVEELIEHFGGDNVGSK